MSGTDGAERNNASKENMKTASVKLRKKEKQGFGAWHSSDFKSVAPFGVGGSGEAERKNASKRMSIATPFCGNLEPTRMRWCINDKCF